MQWLCCFLQILCETFSWYILTMCIACTCAWCACKACSCVTGLLGLVIKIMLWCLNIAFFVSTILPCKAKRQYFLQILRSHLKYGLFLRQCAQSLERNGPIICNKGVGSITIEPSNPYPYVVLMLVHSLRRWPNIKTTSFVRTFHRCPAHVFITLEILRGPKFNLQWGGGAGIFLK